MRRVWFLVVVGAAVAALTLGQESRPSATTRPVAQIDPAVVRLKAAYQRFGATIVTCPRCKGKGKVRSEPDRGGYGMGGSRNGGQPRPIRPPPQPAFQPCGNCDGRGYVTKGTESKNPIVPQSSPQNELECLAAYLDYLDLATEHRNVIEHDRKLYEQWQTVRERAAALLPTHATAIAAAELHVGKTPPEGQPVAFGAEVLQLVKKADGTLVVQLLQEHRSGEYLHWLVEVPSGVRWVPGAKLVVIGRIGPDQDYRTILGDKVTASWVVPYPGTR